MIFRHKNITKRWHIQLFCLHPFERIQTLNLFVFKIKNFTISTKFQPLFRIFQSTSQSEAAMSCVCYCLQLVNKNTFMISYAKTKQIIYKNKRKMWRIINYLAIVIIIINVYIFQVYKEYFPEIAIGYEDSRVILHVCDGT